MRRDSIREYSEIDTLRSALRGGCDVVSRLVSEPWRVGVLFLGCGRLRSSMITLQDPSTAVRSAAGIGSLMTWRAQTSGMLIVGGTTALGAGAVDQHAQLEAGNAFDFSLR